MADAELEQPYVPRVPIPARGRSPWTRGLACVAIVPLLGLIGQNGRSLWDEWRSLRREQSSERNSVLVGYVNITPNPSFAQRPPDWFHDEGDATLLWSGWRENQNHWYRASPGEIDRRRLSFPLGKDAIQAIDYPLFELEGGQRWSRVPAEAFVVSVDDRGESTAYPLRVLDKVGIVNDLLGGRPVMLVCSPIDDSISIFDATLEGGRVTMGHSGYFLGRKPLLYDRATESLWSEEDGAMVALTGRRKGDSLKRIALLSQVTWSEWKGKHPEGRLLIGADRSRPKPVD